MSLEKILKWGKRVETSQAELARFNEDPSSYDVVTPLIKASGREKHPAFANLLRQAPDMNPGRKRAFAEKHAAKYQLTLVSRVLEDLDEAVGSFREPKDLAVYLLSIDPSRYSGANQVFHKAYEGAYAAQQFINAIGQKDEEGIQRGIESYIKSEAEKFAEDEDVTEAMVDAMIWAYNTDRNAAASDAMNAAKKKVKSFIEGLSMTQARGYIEERFAKIEDKYKAEEALVLGRTITALKGKKPKAKSSETRAAA